MTTTQPLSPADLRAARGHIRSLSSSAAKAIIELQGHAETARKRGDLAARTEFIKRAHAISDAMTALYLAQDRMRLSQSLNGSIAELGRITAATRKASSRISRITKALDGAADVIDGLTRLLKLVK